MLIPIFYFPFLKILFEYENSSVIATRHNKVSLMNYFAPTFQTEVL